MLTARRGIRHLLYVGCSPIILQVVGYAELGALQSGFEWFTLSPIVCRSSIKPQTPLGCKAEWGCPLK